MPRKKVARSEKSRSQLTKTDRAEMKKEQAAFVKKFHSAVANSHQQAIFEAAKTQAGRYVVLAGPGSGKTFTSIKASFYFTGSSIYFSYNRKIKIDTNEKLIAIDSPMIASTSHSFGLGCLMSYTQGQCQVDNTEKKYPQLIDLYMIACWQMYLAEIRNEIEERDADVSVMRLEARRWTGILIHYAMMSLAPLTDDGLRSVVEAFDLNEIKPGSLAWPFVVNAVITVIDEGKKQFLEPEHTVVYDDMIYYPNVIPMSVRQFDHVIVDEAQDTSRAGLELILKACHANTQIFFVGDPRQSIYLFAGAAFNSIDQIIERLHAQTLPLRICYRCGSKIIDLANQLGGELIAAGQHAGNVEVIGSDYVDRLHAGDAVLARTTAKLIDGCLKTLQTGKKAKVLGRDLGVSIVAVVTSLEAMRENGIPQLLADLSNLLMVLSEYQNNELKSLMEARENPEMAMAEVKDKVATVRAFFEAYVSKCHNESLRMPDDPQCAFNKTTKDFKEYIKDLFVDTDENLKRFILFMTAHRAKGGEWENVFIIGTEEFPHSKAKSERQKEQEANLMYVAVTRAINNLYFVNAPFSCLDVPGYEPAQPLTIVSVPALEHLEVYPSTTVVTVCHDQEFADEQPITVEATLVEPVEELQEGKVSRISAIEVLCPTCNSSCVDQSGSSFITYELVGHTVTCSACQKACIVPLNAFNLRGDVVAREKPATGVTNSKVEKKGRTKKERKSTQGRKTKGSEVREPLQLSLDVKTIKVLNAMGVNKSQLFEELLQMYEPFLEAWETYEDDETGELDGEEEEE
jgi:DNA helicase II / ATP-dependent DNA helicase PcrA